MLSSMTQASPSKIFYEQGVAVDDLWYKDLVRDVSRHRHLHGPALTAF